MCIKELKSALNRFLDVGHTKVTKSEIVQACAGDFTLAMINLHVWQESGWLAILADLDSADVDDVCVEMLGYIDNDKPWSDPMSGKM